MRKYLLSTVAMSVVAAAIAWSGPVAADDFNGNGPDFGRQGNNGDHGSSPNEARPDAAQTATPIKHLVVIFNENRSFDNYFATYPTATNPSGEPVFKAARNTPAVNNLSANPGLLTNNPNFTNTANGVNAANPFRLDRTQANTADMSHSYTPEQEAYDNGKMDLFPLHTGNGTAGGAGAFGTKGQVMGYFDGNTVTGYWNYAQNFAMSDNAYTDTFGPSTPGALEVFSGQTDGATYPVGSPTGVSDGQGGYTQNGDTDPGYDVCSSKTSQVMLTGKNIGDLLNAAHLPWGSFAGGFNLGLTNANGTTGCARSTYSAVLGGNVPDYVQHHMWFQYFASTANPTHARPSSTQAVGYSTTQDGRTADPANHDYDLNDFYAAVKAGNYPSVSYIKMAAYQDGHPGNSDPLDEQDGVVSLVNFLQQQPDWKNTAVIVTYDDSDGWYDHDYATPTSASYNATADQVNGPGKCGTGTQPDGLDGKPVNGRCGPGTRIPFLVISPYARQNYVGHDRISQASVVRFIEDNWLRGERLGGGSFDASAGSIDDLFDFGPGFGQGARNNKLFLDPSTGTVVASAPANGSVFAGAPANGQGH
jgi:phospholipase C